jgi:hypothetical protein
MSLTEVKRERRAARDRELAAATLEASRVLGRKLYAVILADPPMTLDEIKALPVPVTKDAVLFLWATVPMLAAGARDDGRLGFTYKSSFAWVKDKRGLGFWSRNRHELLLVGTCGNIPRPAPGEQLDSVIEAPRGRHSEKPVIVREMIAQMFPICRSSRCSRAVSASTAGTSGATKSTERTKRRCQPANRKQFSECICYACNQGTTTMSNTGTTTMPAPAVPAPTHGDDFNYVEDGGNSIIKGLGKLAFGNDAKWQLRDEVIAPATPMREFIILEHKRFVQEWGVDPGPPLSTRELQPDEYFPDVERLNEETPKERWRMSFGQLKGPFENVHALYLLEQANMNAFTYVGTSAGLRPEVRSSSRTSRSSSSRRSATIRRRSPSSCMTTSAPSWDCRPFADRPRAIVTCTSLVAVRICGRCAGRCCSNTSAGMDNVSVTAACLS